MKPFLLAVAAVVMMAPAAMAADKPAASADLRGPGSNTHHKVLYCVKNAESGACEDCWSDGAVSSARGTCNLLKDSTNDPRVRKGKCALPANQKFCGLPKK